MNIAPNLGCTQERHPVLDVRDVSFAYGPKKALDSVSFQVPAGRFTALLGPNGAGKSTLFSLITRLFMTRQGEIYIDGENIRTAGSGSLSPLGIVFQQTTLDLDLTVEQNLLYFGSLRGFTRRQSLARAKSALASLSMAERLREKVRALNGGHRRRVEIARALLHDPYLLLLDEPTVGLDPETRRAIVEHVHTLASERSVAVLWATHLIDEIRDKDGLVVLHRGQVVANGSAAAVVKSLGETDLSATFSRLTTTGPVTA